MCICVRMPCKRTKDRHRAILSPPYLAAPPALLVALLLPSVGRSRVWRDMVKGRKGGFSSLPPTCRIQTPHMHT